MATAHRADQVGSLLRPPRLADARAAYGRGEVDKAELEQMQDEAILAALRRQQTIGFDLFTDGEFRRTGFQNDMIEAVEGFVDTGRPAVVRVWQGPGGEPVVMAQAGAGGRDRAQCLGMIPSWSDASGNLRSR